MMLSDVKGIPMVNPPLGLAYIASVLREAGHAVRAIDALGDAIGQFTECWGNNYLMGMTLDEIVGKIEPDTEVVGVTIMFSDYWILSRELIKGIRQRLPHVKIMAGGEHVTACPRLVLQDSPLDFAVMGEGEETAVELLDHLSGKPESLPLDQIAGLAYKRSSVEIVVNPRRSRKRNIDDIPWPAWDLFPVEKYMTAGLFHATALGRRTMAMLGTRGCPYTCKFCSNDSMWGTRYFMRDPKDLVDEMEDYIRTYGASDFQFQDLTLVINNKWAKSFCREIISRHLNITWKLTSGTRTEAMDLELLQLMRDSGCNEILLAPESGSERILEIYRKKVELDKILWVVRTIRDYKLGIETVISVIVGSPEETTRDLLRTYSLLFKLAWSGADMLYFQPLVVYPGSEYHEIALREGRLKYDDEYFLRLDRKLKNSKSASWHPRWKGRTFQGMILVGYLIFFGTYYLSRPLQFLKGLVAVLRNKPGKVVERYFSYRLWQPLRSNGAKESRQDTPAI